MNIGRLDRKIAIESLQLAEKSASGEETRVWAVVAEVWASVTRQTGREFVQGQTIGEGRVVFTMRYRDGIEPDMRIRYNGSLYDIQDVRELGRRAGLELQTISHDSNS